jgi:hypothetical protein
MKEFRALSKREQSLWICWTIALIQVVLGIGFAVAGNEVAVYYNSKSHLILQELKQPALKASTGRNSIVRTTE